MAWSGPLSTTRRTARSRNSCGYRSPDSPGRFIAGRPTDPGSLAFPAIASAVAHRWQALCGPPYRPAMPSDELPADRSTRQGHSRVRGVAFRVVLVLFALVWLTFGFGVIDFASGFASVDDRDPRGIGVLSVAYGAVAGIVLAVAFLALLRTPQRRPAAVQQLAAVGLAFALAGTIGLDPLSFISVGMVLVMLAAVLALHPARPRLWPDRNRTDRRCSRSPQPAPCPGCSTPSRQPPTAAGASHQTTWRPVHRPAAGRERRCSRSPSSC